MKASKMLWRLAKHRLDQLRAFWIRIVEQVVVTLLADSPKSQGVGSGACWRRCGQPPSPIVASLGLRNGVAERSTLPWDAGQEPN